MVAKAGQSAMQETTGQVELVEIVQLTQRCPDSEVYISFDPMGPAGISQWRVELHEWGGPGNGLDATYRSGASEMKDSFAAAAREALDQLNSKEFA